MEEEIMRNYTKEELNKIISEISNDIVEKNTQLLIDESAKCMMEEKSSADTIIQLCMLFYKASQRNCEDTIAEVLNKIMND